jgi:hypothetical protein
MNLIGKYLVNKLVIVVITLLSLENNVFQNKSFSRNINLSLIHYATMNSVAGIFRHYWSLKRKNTNVVRRFEEGRGSGPFFSRMQEIVHT